MRMIALIEDNRDAIVALCEQYGVQRLAVFGSAVKGTFNPETSDLDFVLEFTDYGPGVAKRFIYFANSLEALFGRSVDLVFESKLSNPAFRQEVLTTMEPVFDASERRQAIA
jgi:predicted nucleotidyltransferase